MRKPQSTNAAVLLAFVLFLSLVVQAQQLSDLDSGIALYRSGDCTAAIKLLQTAAKQKQDELSARHYLGLAFEGLGKTNEARKSHEKAARLGSEVLEKHFHEESIGDSRSLSPDIHEPLKQAADSAERYLALKPNLSDSDREDWEDRTESLNYFAGLTDPKKAAAGENRIFSSKEVTTKAKILTMREPMYTEEARKEQVRGTIILRAIFGADGKVRGVFPVTTLPNGLTRSAINAARGIRFEPAMKDGKPVSMFMQMEYSFNFY